MPKATQQKRLKPVTYVARGRLATIKRRRDRVRVVPRVWHRVRSWSRKHRDEYDGVLRTVRFNAGQVEVLEVHPPGRRSDVEPEGWIRFDFGEGRPSFSDGFRRWNWRGFERLARSGWRRVALA